MLNIKHQSAYRGLSASLALALAMGMAPAVASAQEANQTVRPDAVALASAGFNPVEGQTYTVPVSLMNASQPDQDSMAASYFSSTAEAVYQDGVFTVKMTTNAPEQITGIRYQGTAATVVSEDASSRVFQFVLPSLSDAALTLSLYVPQMGGATDVEVLARFDTSGLVRTTDKTALANAVDSAEAIERNGAPDVDWNVLQRAIGNARSVLEDEDSSQDAVDAEVNALKKATDAFQGIAGYQFVEGGSYVMPMTWVQPDGSDSHAGRSFASSAEVRLVDGRYDVRISTTPDSDAMITAITYGEDDQNASVVDTDTASGTRQFQLFSSSATQALKVGFSVQVPGMGTHNQSAYLMLDTTQVDVASEPVQTVDTSALQAALTDATSLTQGKKSPEAWSALQTAIAAAQNTIDDSSATQGDVDAQLAALNAAVDAFSASADVPEGDGNNNGNNNGNGANEGNGNDQEQKAAFEVGHTYQVPLAFLRSGSSQPSMAAQYFGDVALVRPQPDGTFDVRFSTNRPDYIVNMYHQGSALPVTGGDGVSSAEYSLSISATTSDTVVPLSMTIKPMQELGGGDVSVDMHLYLTQAEDRGTGMDALVASPAITGKGAAAAGTGLPQTGDDVPWAGVAVTAALAGAGMAVAGAVGRRRRESR